MLQARMGVLAGLAMGMAGTAAMAQEPPLPPAHPVKTVHHQHRHGRHRAAPHPKPVLPPAAPDPAAGGMTPAPVPNPDIGPPSRAPDPRASLDPGTMQLHYPPVGEGYTPGSSPAAMDDARTAKVPGVMVNVPLQPNAPQPLPPPDGGH